MESAANGLRSNMRMHFHFHKWIEQSNNRSNSHETRARTHSLRIYNYCINFWNKLWLRCAIQPMCYRPISDFDLVFQCAASAVEMNVMPTIRFPWNDFWCRPVTAKCTCVYNFQRQREERSSNFYPYPVSGAVHLPTCSPADCHCCCCCCCQLPCTHSAIELHHNSRSERTKISHFIMFRAHHHS